MLLLLARKKRDKKANENFELKKIERFKKYLKPNY